MLSVHLPELGAVSELTGDYIPANVRMARTVRKVGIERLAMVCHGY
ncbi:MAG: hypothetical protein K6F92_09195 [Lachnospiraceae bacterium]|nr:hypothetical protein [Lachnospiraceae bacterium]